MGRSVQIRNVPDSIHRVLKARAAAAGVSLSDYLLGELKRVAERPAIADVLARAQSRGSGTTTEEVVRAVRSGRDRA
jgi:plasmid stability protein